MATYQRMTWTLVNPPEHPLELDEVEDRDLLLCLWLFLMQHTASQETYNASIDAIKIAHPDSNLLSYNQVKHRMAHFTGIKPIVNDMCPNSCMAYTGPFSEHETCPCCKEARYDPITRVPGQWFSTIPIGPQIQARKRQRQSADNMDYFTTRLKSILAQCEAGSSIEVFDDIVCGNDVLGWSS